MLVGFTGRHSCESTNNPVNLQWRDREVVIMCMHEMPMVSSLLQKDLTLCFCICFGASAHLLSGIYLCQWFLHLFNLLTCSARAHFPHCCAVRIELSSIQALFLFLDNSSLC